MVGGGSGDFSRYPMNERIANDDGFTVGGE